MKHHPILATAIALALPAWTLCAQEAQPPRPPEATPQAQGNVPGHHGPGGLFGALDGNHDGVVDAGELSHAAEVLGKLDLNGDGKLTPDELRPHGGRSGGGPRDGQAHPPLANAPRGDEGERRPGPEGRGPRGNDERFATRDDRRPESPRGEGNRERDFRGPGDGGPRGERFHGPAAEGPLARYRADFHRGPDARGGHRRGVHQFFARRYEAGGRDLPPLAGRMPAFGYGPMAMGPRIEAFRQRREFAELGDFRRDQRGPGPREEQRDFRSPQGPREGRPEGDRRMGPQGERPSPRFEQGPGRPQGGPGRDERGPGPDRPRWEHRQRPEGPEQRQGAEENRDAGPAPRVSGPEAPEGGPRPEREAGGPPAPPSVAS